MNEIQEKTRSQFFVKKGDRKLKNSIPKNNKDIKLSKKTMIKKLPSSKVNIDQRVKDFLKIKKAINEGPEVDKTKKIEELKSKVKSGQYEIDYEELAKKMMTEY